MSAKRFNNRDSTTQRQIEEIRLQSNRLATGVFAAAQYLKVDGEQRITLTAGTNRLTHKLGRRWTGFLVTYRNGAADVYELGSSTPADPKTFIELVASGTVTVEILIF